MTSLMENAFETFTGADVSLSANIENQKVIIHVEDNCGGIPENEKPFLFDPSKSRKKGGTGLGLAISKQLALCMDAELSLKKVMSLALYFPYLSLNQLLRVDCYYCNNY